MMPGDGIRDSSGALVSKQLKGLNNYLDVWFTKYECVESESKQYTFNFNCICIFWPATFNSFERCHV